MFIIFLIIFIIILSSIKTNPQDICIIERCGKFHRTVSGKFIFLIPIVENIRKSISLDIQIETLIPQPVISKDNHTFTIEVSFSYLIIDPVKATYEIENVKKGLEYLIIVTLRDLIGNIDSSLINESKNSLISDLKAILDESTTKWGVKIESIDFRLIQKNT